MGHLGALAVQTERIRLGTLMTSATFRPPGPLAIQVAQVDQMSGGRVEFGIGAGWYEAEHTAYGIPLPSLAERFERLDEQLAIVTGLQGRRGRALVRGQPLPARRQPGPAQARQEPYLPVIVGGKGRAGRRALPPGTRRVQRPVQHPGRDGGQYDRVRAACEAAGRDPATMILSAQVLCCGADEAEVRRRAAAIDRDPGELRESGLAGTPDEVVDKVQRFAELGATRLYLQVLDLDDLDHIALVAKEVLPRVA